MSDIIQMDTCIVQQLASASNDLRHGGIAQAADQYCI